MDSIVAKNVVVLVLILAPAATLLAFKDGPPADRTGGFGSQSCIACHTGNPLNAPGTTLKLEGLPTAYAPGTTYKLTVTLTRASNANTGPLYTAGFQIAARTAPNAFAGMFRPLDDQTQLIEKFLEQSQRGARVPDDSPARWQFEWTAPSPATGDIVFNVAANASNDDASALDDHIYTLETRVPAR